MKKAFTVALCLLLCACAYENTTITPLPTGTTVPPIKTTVHLETAAIVATPTASLTPEPTENQTAESISVPALYIYTDKKIDSVDTYISARVNTADNGSGYTPFYEAAAEVRGRGHSTWKWAKKPYKLRFFEPTALFGMGQAKNWILLASYADKSLARNYVASAMASVLSFDFTPQFRYAELYINDDYMGVYCIGEEIQAQKNRVVLSDSADADTGFLLEIGGMDEGNEFGTDYFSTGFIRFAAIKAPDTDYISKEQADFIYDYISATDKAITGLKDYENYIDVQSFIEWSIIQELSYNIDSCFRRSCYMTKDRGGLLKMGPIWDFDLAFGNFTKDNPKYNDWATVGPGKSDLLDYSRLKNMNYSTYKYADYYVLLTWFNYLMCDDDFRAAYSRRWNEVKPVVLAAAENALSLTETRLEGAWQRNFKRWNILSGKPGYSSSKTGAIKTYDGQLQYIRDFITARAEWLDSALAE